MTTKNAINYLDLDALAEGEEKVIVKLNQKEHELMPVTFKDFILNMRDLQKIGTSPSMEEEMELSRSMILRAFPSMSTEDIDTLRLTQLQAIVNFAHTHNGQKVGEDEASKEAKDAPNPPVAA